MMKEKMYLPSLRGVLGKWVYYSTLMTAEQISTWVKPAKEIRESKILDDYLQRNLKERRKAIAKYLLNDDFRFFNSIIVGVFGGVPEWVEFDLSKFKVHVNQNEVDISKDSVGVLIFDGDEQMFAIDGQHRVAGIQIAFHEDRKKLTEYQELNDDQFSVVFVAHIDDELGKKRTRKLFSDINKNAKPVAAGDKIKIDEEDICAIVTRRIYANYPHFEGGKKIAVTENSNLDPKDITNFTNLTGLYTTIKILRKELFKMPKGTKEFDEDNVQSLLTITTDFFEFIIEYQPELNQYFLKKSITLESVRLQKTNILFRPVGLFLISRLYCSFYKSHSLSLLSENLKLISFKMPDSPFKNILWTNGKMETKGEKQTFAFQLSLYLLKQYSGKVEELLKEYREILKNENAELPQTLIE